MTKLFEMTEQPLSLDDAAARVSRVHCGAITTFAGMVRGETATEGGQRGTEFLNYEAYAAMAEKMLKAHWRRGDEALAQGGRRLHLAPYRPTGDGRGQRHHRRLDPAPGRWLF